MFHHRFQTQTNVFHAHCSDLERKLLSFPPKLGELGIPIFSETPKESRNFPPWYRKI